MSAKNRILLAELVRTDFKLRYQGSVLGYAWSLLRPLFMFAIMYVVFTKFLRLGDSIENYPIYLLLGIVLWQFFADLTTQSLGSVVARGDLIRKISIPRWLIVLTSSFSALINLGLNLLVVALFMIFSKSGFGFDVLYFPFAILEIYIFALGVAFFLSAAFVKYRDISFIWDVVMQAGFYFTPVIYPLSLVDNVTLQKLLLLNPIGQSIQDARNFIVTKETLTIAEVWGTSTARLLPLAVCLVVLLVGILYFRKESKYFAENI